MAEQRQTQTQRKTQTERLAYVLFHGCSGDNQDIRAGGEDHVQTEGDSRVADSGESGVACRTLEQMSRVDIDRGGKGRCEGGSREGVGGQQLRLGGEQAYQPQAFEGFEGIEGIEGVGCAGRGRGVPGDGTQGVQIAFRVECGMGGGMETPRRCRYRAQSMRDL